MPRADIRRNARKPLDKDERQEYELFRGILGYLILKNAGELTVEMAPEYLSKDMTLAWVIDAANDIEGVIVRLKAGINIVSSLNMSPQ